MVSRVLFNFQKKKFSAQDFAPFGRARWKKWLMRTECTSSISGRTRSSVRYRACH
jgi:hypothetical protein